MALQKAAGGGSKATLGTVPPTWCLGGEVGEPSKSTKPIVDFDQDHPLADEEVRPIVWR